MNEQTLTINHYTYSLWHQKNDDTNYQWLLLHGFMGSYHDFDTIIADLPGEIIALNLLGFNTTDTVTDTRRFTMSQQIIDIVAILKWYGWDDVHLLGYSMGGRLALGFALQHPEMLRQLILESASPGLTAIATQKQRRQLDQQRAAALLDDFPAFISKWEQLPLFASQSRLPSQLKVKIRQQRLNQNPNNMATSLIQMGTGQQPNYWPSLAHLDVATTVIVGELDQKFRQIGSDMLALLPNARLYCLAQAGHNCHLERPQQFLESVLNDL